MMREIPYYPTRQALYTPQIGPTVLAPGLAATEALLAAECARLAYKKFDRDRRARDEVIAALAAAEYGDVAFFTAAGTDAFAAVRASSANVVVAFRGTERDPRDLATDLKVWKTAWPGGGLVHAGFAKAFAAIWPPVERWLAAHRGRPLLAGHSLGGALATLAASACGEARLVTFGCPRVGDAAFLATLAGVDVTRYVGCCDVVCRVPPARFGFAHPDPSLYIDRDGAIRPLPAESDLTADRRRARREYVARYAGRKGNVLVRDLADHAPLNYVAPLLWADANAPPTSPAASSPQDPPSDRSPRRSPDQA
jgi:hypothetical protein